MKKITVPAQELFDPKTGTFFYTKPVTLVLEHSLLSLSKWESDWEKPFIDREHTVAEFNDYIRCMTLTQNVDPSVYDRLTDANRKEVQAYIDRKMSAAVIHSIDNQQQSKKFMTADLIYYYMVEAGVPFDPCQKWHLNRLLMLLRIIGIERKSGSKSGKTNKLDSARRHADINHARRASKGKR